MSADTEYQVALIKAYLSPEDSKDMPFGQAASLAVQLDAQAAAALEESIHTGLRLEEAARVANQELDHIFVGSHDGFDWYLLDYR